MFASNETLQILLTWFHLFPVVRGDQFIPNPLSGDGGGAFLALSCLHLYEDRLQFLHLHVWICSRNLWDTFWFYAWAWRTIFVHFVLKDGSWYVKNNIRGSHMALNLSYFLWMKWIPPPNRWLTDCKDSRSTFTVSLTLFAKHNDSFILFWQVYFLKI